MKNIAPVGQRLLAAILDFLVGITIYQVLILTILSTRDIGEILNASATTLIYIVIVLPIVVPLVNIFLITMFSGTIGKLASGLAIVDPAGKHLTFTKAFYRNVVGHIVSGLFFWLGYIWIFIDHDRRAWHDMIADSYVVKKTETGLVTGLLALLILLGTSGYIGYLSFKNILANMPIYTEAMQDVIEEFTTKGQDPGLTRPVYQNPSSSPGDSQYY